MSQSGAILVWLAETTGKFAPGAGQRYEALRWIMFDNHKFTNNHAHASVSAFIHAGAGASSGAGVFALTHRSQVLRSSTSI